MRQVRHHIKPLGLAAHRFNDQFARKRRRQRAVPGKPLCKPDIAEPPEMGQPVHRYRNRAAPRIFVGCGWESNVAQIADKFLADPASGCPGNYKALLESAQHEAKMIWSQTGLTAIEMAGLISWLTLFVGIAMIVAAFVTYQTKAK